MSFRPVGSLLGEVHTSNASASWVDNDRPGAIVDPQVEIRLHRQSGERCPHCKEDLAVPFRTAPRGLALLLGIAARFGRIPDSSARYDVPIDLHPPGRPGFTHPPQLGQLCTGSWVPINRPTVSVEAAGAVAAALDKYLAMAKPARRGDSDPRFELRPGVDCPDPTGLVESALALPPDRRRELVGPFREFLAGGGFTIG